MVTQIVHRQNQGGAQGLIDRLKFLRKRNVLVGIPQKNSTRGGESINNADLLYIHTHGIRKKSMRDEMNYGISSGLPYSAAYTMYILSHGSPLWAAPPRPVLEPAIEYHKDAISILFAKIIKAASKGDKSQTDRAMERLGLSAQRFCQRWFTNPANGWDPNSPFTVKRKGSDKPLIDTGALRKAITYVVRDV